MITYEAHRSGPVNYWYEQIDRDFSFSPHMHKSLEIFLVEEGRILCQIKDRQWQLEGGQCVLILPEQVDSFETMGESKSRLCIYSENYVPDFCREMTGFSFENPVFAMPKDVAFRDLSAVENPFFQKAALYRICAAAWSSCGRIKEEGSRGDLPARIIAYIQEHYTGELSLKNMARELGYSYAYLSTFFNQTMGMGFGAFVNQYRIAYAEQLLLSTRLSVTEIAEACGFSTIRSFNREFLRSKTVSPSEFRKKRAYFSKEPKEALSNRG